MSRYLIPAYVQRAGWELIAAYDNYIQGGDLARLHDTAFALAEALRRDPNYILFAPDDITDTEDISTWEVAS